MFQTLKKIRSLLQTTFGDVFRSYIIDDPNLVIFSELPCLYIAPVSTDINIADTQRDTWTYTIDIGLIIDAKQELLKYKQEMVGTQFLTEIMEAKDDNGILKPNTVLYVLRRNLNLGSNWSIQNISSVDYSVRLRGEVPDQFVCKESTIRLTVTRIQNRP